MFKRNYHKILKEIDGVLSEVKGPEIKSLISEIIKSETTVTIGAGRVGMAARAFAMRLGHLGFRAYTIGDSTLPALTKRDLLLVCSGSGETQTIYDLVVRGKERGSRIILITANPNSRIGKLADSIVKINAPSKNSTKDSKSVQPMTTLNEQCLSIFFDTLVLEIMSLMRESSATMWARHSNLE